MKILYLFLFLNFCVYNTIIHAKNKLADYASNTYSQFGEDGIIKKIFEVIGTTSKIAVEFGAWDGFYLSNTAHLWAQDLSWRAVLIEADQKKYTELLYNTAPYNCLAINAYVGIAPETCLETLLKKNGVHENIDILSIDIDGNDYHIFESLQTIRPRLIVCEYNPTIPIAMDVYAPYAFDNNFGCSVGALNRIAQEKGYVLVALTITNAFYIQKRDFDKFSSFETRPELLNVNEGHITLATTYDGKFVFLHTAQPVYYYGITQMYQGKLCGPVVRFGPSE